MKDAVAVQQQRAGNCAVVRPWLRFGGVEPSAVAPAAPTERLSDRFKAAWEKAISAPLEEPLVPIAEAISARVGLAALAPSG